MPLVKGSSPRLPAQGDHRAWLAHWAGEMLRAMHAHVAGALEPAGAPWSMNLEHAVRSARMCHYHATRVQPSLRWKDEDNAAVEPQERKP